MDLSAVKLVTISTVNVASSASLARLASSASTKARSVTPLQRQQWRQAGQCVRCGLQGHWVQDCPQRPASPTRVEIAQRPALLKQVAIAEALNYYWLETDDDDNNSGGDLCYDLLL